MAEVSAPVAPGAQPRRKPRRGFQPLRDLPTIVWFLLLVIATIVHRWVPMPGWLMLHLLFLGAATHSIFVWSQHFTTALTRKPFTDRDQRAQTVRLLFVNLGAVLVLVGVPLGIWVLTAVGAALLIAASIWHGISIVRRLRGALPGRFVRTVRYYAVSAAFLPIGSALGVWIAGDPGAVGVDPGRLVLAHAIINVLGWIGITVAGTLVTLWPTMLRTRADDRSAVYAARALPVLGGAVLIGAVGAALGFVPLIALGFAAYAVGLGILGVTFATAARRTAPRSISTLSSAAALCWWVACLVVLTVQSVRASLGLISGGTGDGIALVQQAIDWAAPFLAAGFVAQILVGALSYLVPVALGGGPTPVRIGTAALDRGAALRVATANAALFVCALPVTSLSRVAASLMYVIAMASFLWFLIVALRRQGRAKRGAGGSDPRIPGSAPPPEQRGPIAFEGTLPGTRRAGHAIAGLLAVTLVVAVCYAVEPERMGPISPIAAGASVTEADAPVQTVEVTAADMSFTPDRIEVPVGTRLVIELVNTDESLVHDLVFENGTGSARLAPGERATIDVGIITGDLAGWCSIVGHRQMGMTLDVVATGELPSDDATGAADGADSGTHDHHAEGAGGESAANLIDLSREPGAGFEAFDAVLKPLPPADGPTTHRITLPVTEQLAEVAPGVRQRLWTFGGTAPGPLFHGRVGDTFEVTLVNDGTIGHSIDFHAGALAPDEPMRTIEPGESLTYTFTATRSGIWMYHCATMPMSAHIANGMYGAVIIEPNDLPEVDRSYALVQGEYYLGPQDGEVDMDRLMSGRADLVTFNGYANQYVYEPLPAATRERVRVWLLDAGPDRASSFHVVGGQFDTVWSEGRYLINRATDTGSQALALQPAQGGFVELTFPEPGHYPFVSHIMTDSERGASGVFAVK